MAEEADEAAKTAAKKAKKQKAKARKRQACSDATSSSQPAASQSLDSPPLASQSLTGSSLLQSNSSGSRGDDLSPDHAPNPFQPDMQHTAAHESAGHITLDEQVSTSGRPAAGTPSASAAAAGASPGADARFLDQLFCCPITKVLPSPYSNFYNPLAHVWQASSCTEKPCQWGGVHLCKLW